MIYMGRDKMENEDLLRYFLVVLKLRYSTVVLELSA